MNFFSVTGKKWIFKNYNEVNVKKYSELFSLNEIVAKLISIRENNIDNIELFLNPTIKNLLPNPLRLKDMSLAIERTYKSLINNESIGIFGDYDVDGATSTALLMKYFTEIKQNVKTYIPDRQREGYGPSINGFNKLIELGSKIIFTVDCGTSSFDVIQKASDRRIDVIVLDHHQSDITLPKATAIVNPNRYDDKSNLNYLCAAGVCFMFLIALNKKLRDVNWFDKNKISEPNILNFLDLVSLGTVCDVVPLIGLNRAIVKQGLKIFKKRQNLGLKTLYDLCKIDSQPSTYDYGFMLGPRINAGGRVGKSSHGVELLTGKDPQKVYKIALDLEKYNNERKSIELLLSEKVLKEVEKFHNHPVIVIAGKNWHEGVIGIVAARIKEKFNKPTILISLNKNIGKGSARSIVGFDIGQNIINAVQLKILKKGGGHKMAGGFTLEENKIDELRDFLIKSYEKADVNVSEGLNLLLDTIIAPSALNEEFYDLVNTLGPFGSGNNEPKFVIENLKLLKSKTIKKNHIKSTLIGRDGTVFNSLAWNAIGTSMENILALKSKKTFNIAGKMKLNEWKGNRKVEFIIEDISTN